MNHYSIYEKQIPDLIMECAETPVVQRLRQIGMNCGCEYTSFPQFIRMESYSRYDHSLGVALIIWHFTHDPQQTVAGLLHDIASPVFAHVVDFLHGDYLTQESTEDGTEGMIRESRELQSVLKKYGLTTEEVCDYHLYPIADNDSPKLSADRLEYTIGNGINYGLCTQNEAQSFFQDLVVGTNEGGEEELMFQTPSIAEAFAKTSLSCSKIYVSDEDRYAMQLLAEILQRGIEQQVISEQELYGTEPEVIDRLLANSATAALWQEFRGYTKILKAKEPASAGTWRKIFAKKRCIDPMVRGQGRVSKLFPAYQKDLHDFINYSHDYWICGDH